MRDWFMRIVMGSTTDGMIAFKIFIEIPSASLLALGFSSLNILVTISVLTGAKENVDNMLCLR